MINKWEKKFEEYLKTQFKVIVKFDYNNTTEYGFLFNQKGLGNALPCVRLTEGKYATTKSYYYVFNMVGRYDVIMEQDHIRIRQFDDNNEQQCLWYNFHTFKISSKQDYEHYCKRASELIKSVKDMLNKYKLLELEEDFV